MTTPHLRILNGEVGNCASHEQRGSCAIAWIPIPFPLPADSLPGLAIGRR